MSPISTRICVPNLVAVRQSCGKKIGGTDRQTKKTAALYIVDYIWIILQYEHGITQFTTEYIDVCFKTHTKWDDLLNTLIFINIHV